MKYILFILATTLLLSSCSDDFFSQTVKIDPPAYDKKLCFHLDLSNQDSVVRLMMTRNFGILEDVQNFQDWFVKGAMADIYEDGQKWLTLSPLSVDSSFILVGTLPHPFKAGSTYEIRTEHPDFPKVTASQIAPEDFQVDSVRIRFDAVVSEYGDRLNILDVFIQDEPGVKNYYEVALFSRYYDIRYDQNGMDTVGIAEFPLYVDGYTDANIQVGYNDGGLVSDQFFNGQSYKYQARFYARLADMIDSTVTVKVRNVTEDYYKWSRSYKSKTDSDNNPLTEPVTVFNNLENGLGIFSIAQEKIYQVK